MHRPSLVAASGGYSSLWCAGFHCGGFSCCGARALGTWASVVVAHKLISCGSWALEHRLNSCGAWAKLLHGMWDLPGPRLEPVFPALAGRFLTTVPPGKPSNLFLDQEKSAHESVYIFLCLTASTYSSFVLCLPPFNLCVLNHLVL